MMLDPTQTYLDEAREMLAELEEALLELDATPGDLGLVARAFRAMHTIKGSGAMFGFEEIARFTHDVETMLDRVRNGELHLDSDMLSLVLSAKDHIHDLLDAPAEGTPELREVSDGLLAQLQGLLAGTGAQAAPAAEPVPAPGNDAEASAGGELATFWIRYTPDPGSLGTGTNPLALLNECNELGVMREIFHPLQLPELEDLDPETAYGCWDILLTTDQGENAVRDVFIFVEDEVTVHRVGDRAVRTSDMDCYLDLFQASPLAEPDALARAVDTLFRDLTSGKAAPPCPAAAAQAPQPRASSGAASSIRVDAERLDSLVNMVGELVIIQSRLAQAVRDAHNPVLAQIAEDMERLMDELSENALSIRMLPFGSMFGGFRRLVRDLAKTLGKPVEFVTEGAETELDKTVIDKLKDPLMHILRNAVDHGLEPSEARRELGKPEQGRVVLSAAHASGEVVITVADDGRGIDPERVRARAVERGLVAPDAVLDEREALGLLFEPGFSTAETVSNISGRGVGMDVVRKSIEGLRGSIDVESTPGRGTRMRIRLPLTLAIIDGLNVRVEQESYILPLAAVEACQERFVEGRPETFDTVERMGQLIPCISLRRLLHVPGEQPGYERIVVVQVDGRQVGLAVDVVVGRQQAVIKSMSGLCKDQDWISGTTINGDGGISLILDVPQLVARAAETTQPQQTRRAA